MKHGCFGARCRHRLECLESQKSSCIPFTLHFLYVTELSSYVCLSLESVTRGMRLYVVQLEWAIWARVFDLVHGLLGPASLPAAR